MGLFEGVQTGRVLGRMPSAVLATKHGKQRQFGPVLAEQFGWHLAVADVDTDVLGTFTGEVERAAGPLATARSKARWGMEVAGCARGIANEGSFHPHLLVPLTVDLEIVVLLDDVEGLEVVERYITTDTTARTIEVTTPAVPDRWLASAGFPSHSLIVSGPEGLPPISKGIADRRLLRGAIGSCLDVHGRATVASDLRADRNPTRQRALLRLAERLADRLGVCCPVCRAPGWGVSSVAEGRTCAWCGGTTVEQGASEWTCARLGCDHRVLCQVEEPGDPAWCPTCNP